MYYNCFFLLQQSNIVLSTFIIATIFTILLSLPWYYYLQWHPLVLLHIFLLLIFSVLIRLIVLLLFFFTLKSLHFIFSSPIYRQLLRRSFSTTLINTIYCACTFTGLWCFIRICSVLWLQYAIFGWNIFTCILPSLFMFTPPWRLCLW